VVHEKADEMRTDPPGNARVALPAGRFSSSRRSGVAITVRDIRFAASASAVVRKYRPTGFQRWPENCTGVFGGKTSWSAVSRVSRGISSFMDNKTTTPDQSGQPDNPATSAPPAVPGHGMASMSVEDLEYDINDAGVKEQPAKPAPSKK
jgi:hypothetical protein